MSPRGLKICGQSSHTLSYGTRQSDQRQRSVLRRLPPPTLSISIVRDHARPCAKSRESMPAHRRIFFKKIKVGFSALSQDARNTLGSHRSGEHTSELQSLMRISYAVFCLKKKKKEFQVT